MKPKPHLIVAIFVAIVAMYEWFVPGLSSARTKLRPVETGIATWLCGKACPRDKARVRQEWTVFVCDKQQKIEAGRDVHGLRTSTARLVGHLILP